MKNAWKCIQTLWEHHLETLDMAFNLLVVSCIWWCYQYHSKWDKMTRTLSLQYTYLLTPWSSVLLEKLTVSAASQKIPRIFGTRRFITEPTSARHLSLS